MSERLAGELLLPNRPLTEVIILRVAPTENGTELAWLGENQLTKDSAADLLHLLHHLARDVFFQVVWVDLPTGREWEVNPVVSALLRQPQFHVRADELLPENRESRAALEALGKMVDYRRIWANSTESTEPVGPKKLRLVTEAAGFACEIYFHGHHLDELVQVGGGLTLARLPVIPTTPPTFST